MLLSPSRANFLPAICEDALCAKPFCAEMHFQAQEESTESQGARQVSVLTFVITFFAAVPVVAGSCGGNSSQCCGSSRVLFLLEAALLVVGILGRRRRRRGYRS